MSTDKPVILTAEDAKTLILILSGQANLIRGKIEPDIKSARLQALATGRTVVIPAWTEAQAREAFDVWAGPDDGWKSLSARDTAEGTWLACARHLGAIK